jgi:hypothetical protein
VDGTSALEPVVISLRRSRSSVLQSEVFEAFRVIDVPKDKALKATAALSRRDDDVAPIEVAFMLLKWMIGFVLAFQIAIALKIFVH